ncbi:hypothetical protein KSP39_PZI018438 [Platanthera zijinensis]|uniref:Dirigent protein n=1 Tax=Platanthera zijinensis TaxID=2320716 RepID=A0AAP0FYR3_9ASPA
MKKASTAHNFPFLLIFLLTEHSSQVQPVSSINAEPMASFYIINGIETGRKSSEILPENGGISAAKLWPFFTCAQHWDSGSVTVIDENMMGNVGRDIHHTAAISMGRVRGMCIVGSDYNINGCIMVMRAKFEINGDSNDSLRFFGVLQRGLKEFQVAVIGGSGRYVGANGFAVVKAVGSAGGGVEKKLMFNVYLN